MEFKLLVKPGYVSMFRKRQLWDFEVLEWFEKGPFGDAKESGWWPAYFDRQGYPRPASRTGLKSPEAARAAGREVVQKLCDERHSIAKREKYVKDNTTVETVPCECDD